jgi:RecJ-like exonuclease
MAKLVYLICPACDGDGIVSRGGIDEECPRCNGVGKLTFADMPEVEDAFSDVLVLVGKMPELQEGLVDFKSQLQDYLDAWKDQQTAFGQTVIQKLNQILDAVT